MAKAVALADGVHDYTCDKGPQVLVKKVAVND